MAVSVLGYVQAGSATATSYSLTTPSQMAVGTTTIIQVASNGNTDISAITPSPADWIPDVHGIIAGLGVTTQGFTRNALGGVSTLIPSGDQPSASLTFSTVTGTSTGRNAQAVTITGGTLRASARVYDGSVASGATETTPAGTPWRQPAQPGTSAGWAQQTYGCQTGDKLIIMLASNRVGLSGATLEVTAGSMTLTNKSLIAESLPASGSQITMQIWTADIGANQTTGTTPTITIKNPTGTNGSYAAYLYVIKPTPAPENGSTKRVMVIGDSITNGSTFAGDVAQTNERYIDRLFGNQTAATMVGGGTVGAITFNTDHVARPAPAGTPANALVWYQGSYTPNDGSPTTNVYVRNIGQRGWDTNTFIKSGWSVGDIANPTVGGYGPDILVINLGANDEYKTISGNDGTPANLRDGLIAMATAFTGATDIVLVKQWGWAYNYASPSTTFTPNDTHANFLAAIDTAATQIRTAGKRCIVVACKDDAFRYGGTNASVPTNSLSKAGLVADTPTASVDNIHPSALGHSSVWEKTIRYGLDQILLLNPSIGQTWPQRSSTAFNSGQTWPRT